MAAKVVVVTGCSTGLGLATATLLAKNGHVVYATLRNLNNKRVELEEAARSAGVTLGSGRSTGGSLHFADLDVSNGSSVTTAIDAVAGEQGRIDVLINNAGFSVAGAVDDLDIDVAKNMFDTNLWGIARTVKATLPHFRKQGSGQIINVSSVGGLIGFPFQEFYCSSKWAVEGYTESLAVTNAKLNIKVSLVEPGPIKTPFIQNAQINPTISDPGVKALYEEFMAGMAASFSSSHAQSPEEVAEVIKSVVDAEKPHLRYQTSAFASAIGSLARADPTGDRAVESMVNRFFKPAQ